MLIKLHAFVRADPRIASARAACAMAACALLDARERCWVFNARGSSA
jgi:hypothetical protein